jgi:hypothetical protein
LGYLALDRDRNAGKDCVKVVQVLNDFLDKIGHRLFLSVAPSRANLRLVRHDRLIEAPHLLGVNHKPDVEDTGDFDERRVGVMQQRPDLLVRRHHGEELVEQTEARGGRACAGNEWRSVGHFVVYLVHNLQVWKFGSLGFVLLGSRAGHFLVHLVYKFRGALGFRV